MQNILDSVSSLKELASLLCKRPSIKNFMKPGRLAPGETIACEDMKWVTEQILAAGCDR